jgi:hypothetical protein
MNTFGFWLESIGHRAKCIGKECKWRNEVRNLLCGTLGNPLRNFVLQKQN